MTVARRIARELGSIEHPTGRSFFMRAMDAAFPPERALHIIACWLDRREAAERFCRTWFPKAEVIVFGHFHLRSCMPRHHRLIIDTGSFVSPGPASVVEWHDGWLKLRAIDESASSFRPGGTIGLWRIG
jgi:hypothetical protein